MAYTPIKPLPTVTNSILGGISEGLSYIRTANELKRQEQAKRADEIVKLLGDVDFPTAIYKVNKDLQKKLYNAAEDSLMSLMSRSAKRGGQMTMDERLQAQEIVKTLQREMNGVSEGEKDFTDTMATTAKKPGFYEPSSVKEYSDNYIYNGINDKSLLKYSKIPFSVMQNKAIDAFKDRIEPTTNIVSGKEITVNKSNMNEQELRNAYDFMANQEPGYGEWEKSEFKNLEKKEPNTYKTYLKASNGDLTSAARKWGEDTLSPNLIPERSSNKPAPKEKTDKENNPIKGLQSQDGSWTWIPGGVGKSYFGPIKTVNGDELSVENAKVSKVYYNPFDRENHGYIELTSSITTHKPMSMNVNKEDNSFTVDEGGNVKETKTYKVPYDQLSSFVTNNYNLLGLSDALKTEPKLQKLTW